MTPSVVLQHAPSYLLRSAAGILWWQTVDFQHLSSISGLQKVASPKHLANLAFLTESLNPCESYQKKAAHHPIDGCVSQSRPPPKQKKEGLFSVKVEATNSVASKQVPQWLPIETSRFKLLATPTSATALLGFIACQRRRVVQLVECREPGQFHLGFFALSRQRLHSTMGQWVPIREFFGYDYKSISKMLKGWWFPEVDLGFSWNYSHKLKLTASWVLRFWGPI